MSVPMILQFCILNLNLSLSFALLPTWIRNLTWPDLGVFTCLSGPPSRVPVPYLPGSTSRYIYDRLKGLVVMKKLEVGWLPPTYVLKSLTTLAYNYVFLFIFYFYTRMIGRNLIWTFGEKFLG
ncbi:hypothetical protein HOY80DRAFT_121131 [Tuber brumale]|nr:hypothetical protein HOY80DRAFT_121131 [Tuber brumale]